MAACLSTFPHFYHLPRDSSPWHGNENMNWFFGNRNSLLFADDHMRSGVRTKKVPETLKKHFYRQSILFIQHAASMINKYLNDTAAMTFELRCILIKFN